jgi:hypothetical protein
MMKSDKQQSLRIALCILCLIVSLMMSGCLVGSTDDSKPDPKVDNSPMFNKLHRESTMGALNAIRTAETSYMSQTGSYGSFNQLVSQQLLDSRFVGERPVVQGYAFSITTGSGSFHVNADPFAGEGRHYYMDQENMIRFNDKESASSGDPILATS